MRHVDGLWVPDEDPSYQKQSPPQRQLVRDINVIPKTMALTKGRKLVIQAGARVGLWPLELAKHFDRVISFEPELENFECAVRNIEDAGVTNKVTLHRLALSNKAETLHVQRNHIMDAAHYMGTTPAPRSQEVQSCTIDSLGVDADMIMLDIEGYELYALQGAMETLKRCRPPLAIEYTGSAAPRYGIARHHILDLLKPLGYKPVDRQYKDMILAAQ